ncbi:MAG: vanadium-dependent haloperoxidase [Bernardetiaceae bacterium]|nr:vanadium-dependent haloperoxidase [Bernardetiaceae bacterium]
MKISHPFPVVLIISALAGTLSCQQQNTATKQLKISPNSPDLIHGALQEITDVVVYDIFSPPVASRIYAYVALAGYEAARWQDTARYPSITARLRGFDPMPMPKEPINQVAALAAVKAMFTVARRVTFSHDSLNAYENKVLAGVRASGIAEELLQQAITFGESVGKTILKRADKDQYRETRGYPRYTVTKREEVWNPTPPDYTDAMEPYWRYIHTLALDSANQFKPPRPIPYSNKKESPYFKEVLDIYQTSQQLTQEQKEIAYFWDDNPFVSHHKGHAVFNSKKLTPGGHWMMIASQIARNTGADAARTAYTLAAVSVALFDGFIACWEEKYSSNMPRPISVINRYLQENWEPFLQTPPFPEYTSGHSVISNAAAEVMTALYGDNFAYNDSTELPYGRKVRSFKSFRQAASECSISRLYGGIHYRTTLSISAEQGKQIGKYVLTKVYFGQQNH